ncbi:hypothetical protein N7462_005984 [Penicillium macrosclerotiorum]|uniref:uncharacterized protein n=1 Tax=Penicillium macrosclerotiorum TaxID=303699 RepID=UPI00254940A4|nr:uncharacterized protein N7462_005984 [Penicillium macrosclerotiorum]KAJ5682819.1 hypothetical protein N7462_005984 [Penicillium macrosclerotiorum]
MRILRWEGGEEGSQKRTCRKAWLRSVEERTAPTVERAPVPAMDIRGGEEEEEVEEDENERLG